MDIRLYNTLTRQKEAFKPIREGHVGMYNCGPTVYDTPHIGNYRTFTMNDLIRRTFEYGGFKVNQVTNITDVDDKTIKRSREEKVPLKTITEKYEKLFFEGLKSLNILTPSHVLRATENIQSMIDLIVTLIGKGFAYAAADGIYLSIAKVKDYGRLANLKIDESGESGKASSWKERVANDEYDKQESRDFALWKFKAAEDGPVSWPAPFGEGRPGWHIECSAMSMKALGNTFDVHTGGNDLIFPHHVNEIAQSESATGAKFAHYWIHGGFVNIKEDKMSKSKHNIVKLEDLLNESISPLSYRYWLLTAHYRSLMNFSFEALHAAQKAFVRLIAMVSEYSEGGSVIPVYKEQFESFISDDFDMPRALALVWDLLKDGKQSPADKRATILDFDRVFGLNLAAVENIPEENIPREVVALAEAREEARKAKDWKKADALRMEIESRGFEVRDSDSGFTVRSK